MLNAGILKSDGCRGSCHCCRENSAGNYCSCSAAHKAATLLHSVTTELLDFKTGTCTKLEIVTSSPSEIGAVTAPVQKLLHKQQPNCHCSWAERSQRPAGDCWGWEQIQLFLGGQISQQRKDVKLPFSLVQKPLCNSRVRSTRCLRCTNSLHYKRGDPQWLRE